MKTIQAIKLLLEEYKQHVERIVAVTRKDYEKQIEEAYNDTQEKLKKLYMLFPDILSYVALSTLCG